MQRSVYSSCRLGVPLCLSSGGAAGTSENSQSSARAGHTVTTHMKNRCRTNAQGASGLSPTSWAGRVGRGSSRRNMPRVVHHLRLAPRSHIRCGGTGWTSFFFFQAALLHLFLPAAPDHRVPPLKYLPALDHRDAPLNFLPALDYRVAPLISPHLITELPRILKLKTL